VLSNSCCVVQFLLCCLRSSDLQRGCPPLYVRGQRTPLHTDCRIRAA
jgi:hypothetical protein